METEPVSHVIEDGQIAESSTEILYLPSTSLESLCRICGVHSDYLLPIFRGEGLDQQLHEKIRKYLPIKVAEGDTLPSNICYHCASTLLAWHELVENCIACEKRLKSLVIHQSKEEESLININEIEVSTLNLDQNGNYSQEKTEDNVFRKNESDQYKIETSVNRITEYPTKKKKRKHEISICLICNKVFLHREYLKTHLLTHSKDRPHLCYICGASFKRRDHASQHRKTVHYDHPDVMREIKDIDEEPVTCDLCGEAIYRKALASHRKRHNTNFNCDICGAVFSMTSLLKSHLIRGHADDSCVCDVCGELHKSGHALYLHKRKHSAAFICYVCGKNFIYQSSLRTHMVVHTEERPWTCEICNKSFKLRTRLKLHQGTHTNLRPYACTCGKSFKTKPVLIAHNNVHNDIRPFPCPHCPFRARKKCDLQCHVRTHTGEKPYKCNECGRGFAQSGDLRKHRRTHERPKI